MIVLRLFIVNKRKNYKNKFLVSVLFVDQAASILLKHIRCIDFNLLPFYKHIGYDVRTDIDISYVITSQQKPTPKTLITT